MEKQTPIVSLRVALENLLSKSSNRLSAEELKVLNDAISSLNELEEKVKMLESELASQNDIRQLARYYLEPVFIYLLKYGVHELLEKISHGIDSL